MERFRHAWEFVLLSLHICCVAEGVQLTSWNNIVDATGTRQIAVSDMASFVAAAESASASSGQKTLKYFLHIPKVAGKSFTQQIHPLIHGAKFGFISAEGCYDWHQRVHSSTQVIVMLRRPRAHVVSQYAHCVAKHGKHLPRTLNLWVQRWLEIRRAGGSANVDFAPQANDVEQLVVLRKTKVPFECFNPVNLQVQRMSCSDPYRYPGVPNIARAVGNLENSSFVGLTEAYQESYCLLHTKVTGRLPSYCNCEDKASWNLFEAVHVTHGVTHGSVAELPEETIKKIDALTTEDWILYKRGRERFLSELGEVERRHGIRILCDASVLL